MAAEPVGLALATKASILASRTSLATYAKQHPLPAHDTSAIRQVVTDQLRHILNAEDTGAGESQLKDAGLEGRANGSKLGWVRLRRKRRQTMQERVFTAPPVSSLTPFSETGY